MTRTPASFSVVEVDGGASLKGFRAFLRRTLEEQRQGRLEYREDGVLIRFELHHPPLDSEIGVCLGYSPDAFWFDDRPAVRAALDEKLKKYPFPLVVALQGIHTGDLFEAAEEELLGGEVIEIPISHDTGGPAGPRGRRERATRCSTGRGRTVSACGSGSKLCSRSKWS